MEKTVILDKYELVLIVDAGLSETDKAGICKESVDAVNELGGKVINSQVWLEKNKLTFDIKKKKEGTYYLINLEIDRALVAKLRRVLTLKENILRFEVIKIEK